MLKTRLLRAVKEVQFQSPLRRYFFPRFNFCFTPPQLCFLCRCLELTRDCEGAIAEVGCASGSTTIFLNKYMDAQHIDKPYYAVDTFAGFVPADVDYEVQHRRKRRGLYGGFQVNKRKWFDATMARSGIQRVVSVEADVNQYDLTTLSPLSFALLDVDLYRPVAKAVRELYASLAPGGIIVVDDCNAHNIRWDGADQAYKEFVSETGLAPNIVHGKLGVIVKPSQVARKEEAASLSDSCSL